MWRMIISYQFNSIDFLIAAIIQLMIPEIKEITQSTMFYNISCTCMTCLISMGISIPGAEQELNVSTECHCHTTDSD